MTGPLFGLVVIGLLFAARAWRANKYADDRTRWLKVAREQNWELSLNTPLTMQARFVDVLVTIELHDLEQNPYIRFSSESATAPPFSFKVRRRWGHEALHLRLGEPFDAAFIIESNDEDLARALLNRSLLHSFGAIARADYGFSLQLAQGRLIAEIGRIKAPGEVLATVARLVASVAGGGRELCAHWAALSRKLEVPAYIASTFPPPPIVLVRQSCIARIELIQESGRWLTRLTWTPTQSTQFDKEVVRKDLPGIVVDGARIAPILDEGFRDTDKSAPYR